MSELTIFEQLEAKQKEMGVRLGGIFPGSNPNTTPEEVAAELLKALTHLQTGEFELVWDSQLEMDVMVDKTEQ